MRITNKYGLPEALVRAVSRDDYSGFGDHSPSGITTPFRLRILKARHEDELSQDVSDMLWMLMGSAAHNVAEKGKIPGSITEMRFAVPFEGKTISMQPDCIEPIGASLEEGYRLYDYKMTSTYAVDGDLKDEWLYQLNLYSWGLGKLGFHVKEQSIIALLKDWSYAKAHIQKRDNYAPAPAKAVEVPLLSPDEIEGYLRDRIAGYDAALQLSDEDLPECSASERWAKPTVYKVKKKGNKTAIRGCANISTRFEAETKASAQGVPCNIEEQKGENVRCDRYCIVSGFCNQNKGAVEDGKVCPF